MMYVSTGLAMALAGHGCMFMFKASMPRPRAAEILMDVR